MFSKLHVEHLTCKGDPRKVAAFCGRLPKHLAHAYDKLVYVETTKNPSYRSDLQEKIIALRMEAERKNW